MKFFEEFVFPTYEKWSLLTENQRKTLFWRRYFKLKSDNLKNRIVNFIGSSSRLSI
jgi:hypothetical protein